MIIRVRFSHDTEAEQPPSAAGSPLGCIVLALLTPLLLLGSLKRSQALHLLHLGRGNHLQRQEMR